MRIEPPVSVPSAAIAIPVATATALPPEESPDVFEVGAQAVGRGPHRRDHALVVHARGAEHAHRAEIAVRHPVIGRDQRALLQRRRGHLVADAQIHAVLAQGAGEQLEQVVALLEHLQDLVEVAGARAREVVEQARGAAEVQAFDVAGSRRLEGRTQRVEKGALLGPQVRGSRRRLRRDACPAARRPAAR